MTACATPPKDCRTCTPFYERIERAIAAGAIDPSAATSVVGAEWMTGSWEVTLVIPGRDESREQRYVSQAAIALTDGWLTIRNVSEGQVAITRLVRMAPEGRWVQLYADDTGAYGLARSERDWAAGELVLLGDLTILGEPVILRSTLRRLSDDAFEVRNEERLGEAGPWIAHDTYIYRRRPAAP